MTRCVPLLNSLHSLLGDIPQLLAASGPCVASQNPSHAREHVGCWGDFREWWQAHAVLTKLVAAVHDDHVSVRRLGLQCAADMLRALDLDWSHPLLQQLLQRLLDDVRASVTCSDSHAQGGAEGDTDAGEVRFRDNIAISRALAAMMARLELEPAVDRLLPDLVAVFALLLSTKQGKNGAHHVQQAALESLGAVATVAKRRMPPAMLTVAIQAIDPFLVGEVAPVAARGDSDEPVTQREMWVESLECLAALAIAGVWDSSALEEHAVWMVERLLLALADSNEDDSSVREAALAAMLHVADALDDSFYPFLPLVLRTFPRLHRPCIRVCACGPCVHGVASMIQGPG